MDMIFTGQLSSATGSSRVPYACGALLQRSMPSQRGRLQPLQAVAQQQSPGPPNAFSKGQEGVARQQLFNNIAPVYDQLNDALSLGLHRVWKRMAVKWSSAERGDRALDVCCGSGDLAFRLSEAVGPSGRVVGLDFAQEMLEDAARRETGRHASTRRPAPIEWVQGDAMQLPFADASFDAATMGYGLRNVSNISKALSELRRVLKPGAKVAILDFNNSPDPTTDAMQGWLLANAVVPLATSLGVRSEYEYLRPSIQQFPTGKEQERLAKRAGFSRAVHYELGFGFMGCLVATK